ncbi:type III secretion system translocator protein VopB2 [Vibrio parahaemolyticus]|uniref:type III secretion system translocator protein VopB2 n=1 Tax=Vibrio parahaemolyticus TaxID=670 RepID=UPI00226A6DBD|nr:type III secretion system translocator protein VopB2 [Vibrio parahaemolyticus]MCX8870166.1 type III secretion system translocator protein VopB2 [Vibrio parahaemolyticus]
MKTSLVNIAENQESLWGQANKEIEKKQNQPQQQAERGSVVPGQPLPGSSVSLNDLWRSIRESMKQVADSVSGSGQEKVATKKGLIELQKDSQIAMLNERASQLEEQKKAQQTQGILGKIAMAFGFIAAIIMAPINPVMAAVMIGGMVASLVIPKIADEIMKSAGVDEKTRGIVKMGLDIAIGLGTMLLSFNPAGIASSAGKAIAGGAAKAAALVKRGVDAAKTLKSFTAISSKAGGLAEKIRKSAQPLLDKIQEFAKGGQMSAARIGQASSVGSNVTSLVSTGYGIKTADISKQMEVNQAKQDELQTRIEQVLKMLDQAMRSVAHSFETLIKTNEDYRSFSKTMTSIHM